MTVVDPGTQDVRAGARMSLLIHGLNASGGARLSYRVSGLPVGVRIAASPPGEDARITGRLPALPRTYYVTVTARDGKATSSSRFRIVAAAPLAASATPGPVQLASTGKCLERTGPAASPVLIQPCSPSSTAQNWTWSAGNAPGSAGVLTAGGLCLTLTSAGGHLAKCARARSQELDFQGFGQFENPQTGECLGVPSVVAGSQVGLRSCNSTAAESWTIPAAPITSGIAGLCIADGGPGKQATTRACSNAPDQQWNWLYSGQIELSHSGSCLETEGGLDGAAVRLASCSSSYAETWFTGPGGQLINGNSGLCLADLYGSRPGAGLAQDDCYGRMGEIWSAN